MRPIKIRMKRERGKLRIITYAMGARGGQRVVGSILTEPSQLKAALEDPDNLRKLGLDRLPSVKV